MSAGEVSTADLRQKVRRAVRGQSWAMAQCVRGDELVTWVHRCRHGDGVCPLLREREKGA